MKFIQSAPPEEVWRCAGVSIIDARLQDIACLHDRIDVGATLALVAPIHRTSPAANTYPEENILSERVGRPDRQYLGKGRQVDSLRVRR